MSAPDRCPALMRRCLPSLAALAVLGACSHSLHDRVVLLPQPGGRPSAVEVSTHQGQRVTLDQPYASAELRGTALAPGRTDAATARERDGALIDALPSRPRIFVVRFEANSNQLTDESKPVLASAVAALGAMPAGEAVVIGHTDRVGSLQANDKLSLARAQAVREQLVAAGVNASRISVAGRGEREPELGTADEIAEPAVQRARCALGRTAAAAGAGPGPGGARRRAARPLALHRQPARAAAGRGAGRPLECLCRRRRSAAPRAAAAARTRRQRAGRFELGDAAAAAGRAWPTSGAAALARTQPAAVRPALCGRGAELDRCAAVTGWGWWWAMPPPAR